MNVLPLLLVIQIVFFSLVQPDQLITACRNTLTVFLPMALNCVSIAKCLRVMLIDSTHGHINRLDSCETPVILSNFNISVTQTDVSSFKVAWCI